MAMTVGQLKKLLEWVPDEYTVVTEIIESKSATGAMTKFLNPSNTLTNDQMKEVIRVAHHDDEAGAMVCGTGVAVHIDSAGHEVTLAGLDD